MILAHFLHSATAFGEQEKAVPIEFQTRITTLGNLPLSLVFATNPNGTLKELTIKNSYFNRKHWGNDPKTAMEEQGFFEKIPQMSRWGKCFKIKHEISCHFKIYFTDEEITNVAVNFTMFTPAVSSEIRGTIAESHSDQGIPQYAAIHDFSGF